MSNVFLVSGRQSNSSGDARGGLVQHVFCASSEPAMRSLVTRELPGFVITSAVSLVVLDRTVKKIKNVLSGDDVSWKLSVESGLD